jgi:hypothetical protein
MKSKAINMVKYEIKSKEPDNNLKVNPINDPFFKKLYFILYSDFTTKILPDIL